MIVVSSPLMRDKIIDVATSIEEFEVKHVKTEGINIFFQTDVADEKALPIIKKAIKGNPKFSALTIKVKAE